MRLRDPDQVASVEELRTLGSWPGHRERQAVSPQQLGLKQVKSTYSLCAPSRGRGCRLFPLTHFPQFQKEICKELLTVPASPSPAILIPTWAIRCTNFHTNTPFH